MSRPFTGSTCSNDCTYNEMDRHGMSDSDKYVHFYRNALSTLVRSRCTDRLTVLNHLMNVGMRYGDVRRNRDVYINGMKDVCDDEMRRAISNGIRYYDLLLSKI